ncbi:MAG: hypothetical protein A2Y56_06355 [Candidatus Aminicenantes bacterium RBG_13_63_10]|nr:MAG: hypothetical protein A2Y56_06355 [Candidatus Aminicenantes bacterium RBG_13_63_10]
MAKFPRLPLIPFATPLHGLEKMSARLAGPNIWMKRDDLTGLAFGGNKLRKLEYILPDALGRGADTIVTWGSLQSNWCLQTAAAARKSGLRTVLILFKTSGLDPEPDGNLFLDLLAGAEVRIVEAAPGKVVSLEAALAHLDAAADEVRSRGGNPYLIPVGGSMPACSMTRPLGAVAYVRALVETAEQARDLGLDVGTIIHATGSGGTQAGLVVGAKALGLDARVIGISVSDEKESFARLVLDICRLTEEALEVETRVEPGDIVVLDDYLGPGYGFVDESVARTLASVFREEAVVLDPVYTAKAMIGLEDLARRGLIPHDRATVFFHTGGTPALFPHRRKILEAA